MTRWEALSEIIDSPQRRKDIGSAWPLYFYLVFKGDKSNEIITSLPKLKEELKEESSATILTNFLPLISELASRIESLEKRLK